MEIQTQQTRKGAATFITIKNARGIEVKLCSVGAGIAAVKVPAADGKLVDVAIGYNEADSYFYDGPCAGKIPGRFANRIAKGNLTVDGKQYQLPINNGENSLHGGPEGFQNQIWEVEVKGENVVEFTHVSPDGDAGYPGTLTAKVTYTITDDNEIRMDLSATTDARTVVNLTNHAYFNLAGESSGSVLDEVLWLKASHYLPTDPGSIPTGEIAPVAGTPMDFTTPHVIGERIREDFPALNYAKGYDHCWVVDDWKPGKMQTVARLEDPKSGRKLEVISDQPGMQVYTGNWLSGSPVGKGGRSYEDNDAVAIECQDFPDAPNKPNFPSPYLNPGEEYHRTIIFKFS